MNFRILNWFHRIPEPKKQASDLDIGIKFLMKYLGPRKFIAMMKAIDVENRNSQG